MGSWRWIDTKNASFEAMNIDEQCLFLNSQVTLVLIDNHVSRGLFQANPMGFKFWSRCSSLQLVIDHFFWIQGSVQESYLSRWEAPRS